MFKKYEDIHKFKTDREQDQKMIKDLEAEIEYLAQRRGHKKEKS